MKQASQDVFNNFLPWGAVPALLIVDFVNAYCDESSKLYAPAVLKAAQKTQGLLKVARDKHLPIIFTKVEYQEHAKDGGVFVEKIPYLKNLIRGSHLGQFLDILTVRKEDIVLSKQYASAFFGTNLASTLRYLQVDTLLICGCSTSGCIRASAVDGMQHGFRINVIEDCVGDRDIGPHEANLFDIQAKYGNVIDLEQCLKILDEHPKGGYL